MFGWGHAYQEGDKILTNANITTKDVAIKYFAVAKRLRELAQPKPKVVIPMEISVVKQKVKV